MSRSLPIPYYYNQMSATERSYVEHLGAINNSIGSAIENNANVIKSSIVDAQVATSQAIYNNAQELKGTLMTGFADVSGQMQSGFAGVSRQLGVMGSEMNMGFAALNSAVQKSSIAICQKLDEINDTLKNPLYTESRELYNRAQINYNKGLYEEALEDLLEAVKKHKTDPFTHLLMGQAYLFGIGEFCNVIDLDKSIESMRNAAKYITHDAQTHNEARLMAAEIWFYLGLANHAKANDALHESKLEEYEKYLGDAKNAYSKSYEYSNNMLESLYNLARCKALLDETDSAIQDLITVIKNDHGYCIKSFVESDFSDNFKNKLFGQLKSKLYPNTKALFERIKNAKAKFTGPYSTELSSLISKYLPGAFDENTPPFDMLKAEQSFPKILQNLEKEHKEQEDRKEQVRKEQERKEQEWRRRREHIEQERREQTRKEQERIAEEKRSRIAVAIREQEEELYLKKMNLKKTIAGFLYVGLLVWLFVSYYLLKNTDLTNTAWMYFSINIAWMNFAILYTPLFMCQVITAMIFNPFIKVKGLDDLTGFRTIGVAFIYAIGAIIVFTAVDFTEAYVYSFWEVRGFWGGILNSILFVIIWILLLAIEGAFFPEGKDKKVAPIITLVAIIILALLSLRPLLQYVR